MKKAIVWFRNDLRITDHEPLVKAIEESDHVIPVFVFDPREWKKDEWGNKRTGPHRTKFLLESLKDLFSKLKAKGAGLIISVGRPEEKVAELAEEFGAEKVFATGYFTTYERRIEQALRSKVNLDLSYGHSLIHPYDLQFTHKNLPDIFTQFRKKTEKFSSVRELIKEPISINSPALPEPVWPTLASFGFDEIENDTRAIMQFSGGLSEAVKRLKAYVWESKALGHYKETRNRMMHESESGKFSPWLANGSLSPRQLYWEVKRFEKEIKKNSSTYWMVFELLWRDYFQFVSGKYGKRLFLKGGLKDVKYNPQQNRKRFESWVNGETGQPFIDAHMRELKHTGWMSNRGRQNVASYLVHDLGLDWRMGASWFEHALLDYDAASNYGNWTYVAGVGNDPRPNRKFNPELQASRYDPNGAYVKRWLGEMPNHSMSLRFTG